MLLTRSDFMNNNFSNNIKTLRNKLNLTQKDFAEKIRKLKKLKEENMSGATIKTTPALKALPAKTAGDLLCRRAPEATTEITVPTVLQAFTWT